MTIDDMDHGEAHRVGESATSPMVPPWGAMVALHLLAGSSQRRRRTLPAHPLTGQSGLSHCRF